MNYYNEIKNELINNELIKKAKDYSKNKSDLMHYYNVGKLLLDAGKQYGEGIIKEYSHRLTRDLGKGYTETNLKYFRQFYTFSKSHTVCDELSWSHYRTLLSISNKDEVEYYILSCKERKLSVRELQKIIKSNEYKRLDNKTKQSFINNKEMHVADFVKNPIYIHNNIVCEKISEKYLKKIILEDIDCFLRELGYGFTYVGNEYKIQIGNKYNYIDMLLFNYKYNCFIVVELKVVELKKEHIGQVQIYMNYVDKNIRDINQNKTIGIIICKKNNKLVLEYSSDPRIFSTTYELIS